MQQARLAHARFGNEIDDAEFGASFVEPALQHLQFAFAPDEGAEAPAHRCFKPGGPLPNGIEPIDFLRLGFALDLMVASEGGLDHPLHQTVRRLAHQHRIRLGKALQARREIHRVAENRNILRRHRPPASRLLLRRY